MACGDPEDIECGDVLRDVWLFLDDELDPEKRSAVEAAPRRVLAVPGRGEPGPEAQGPVAQQVRRRPCARATPGAVGRASALGLGDHGVRAGLQLDDDRSSHRRVLTHSISRSRREGLSCRRAPSVRPAKTRLVLLELTDGARRRRHRERQALGRLPWFAPFFLRDFRLRPRLLMLTPNGGCSVAAAGPDWCSARPILPRRRVPPGQTRAPGRCGAGSVKGCAAVLR